MPKASTEPRTIVEQVASEYGVAQPQVKITAPGLSFRRLLAAAHLIAAQVELTTLPSDGWLVHVEQPGDTTAYVRLELIDTVQAMKIEDPGEALGINT